MKEYFPAKVPPYCNTYWDIIEIRVSGMGVSVEADKVLQAHVKLCKQCQAAQHSAHWTAGTVAAVKQFLKSIGLRLRGWFSPAAQ